eukprot:942530-Rhodomonas_salina.1
MKLIGFSTSDLPLLDSDCWRGMHMMMTQIERPPPQPKKSEGPTCYKYSGSVLSTTKASSSYAPRQTISPVFTALTRIRDSPVLSGGHTGRGERGMESRKTGKQECLLSSESSVREMGECARRAQRYEDALYRPTSCASLPRLYGCPEPSMSPVTTSTREACRGRRRCGGHGPLLKSAVCFCCSLSASVGELRRYYDRLLVTESVPWARPVQVPRASASENLALRGHKWPKITVFGCGRFVSLTLKTSENLSFQVLTGCRTCKTDRRGTLSWARAMHVRIQARGKLVAAEKGVDGQWKDGCMSLEQAFKQHGHFIYPTSHGQVTPNSKDTPVAAGVTTLDFQGSRVGDAGVRKVAHILKANTTITTLNLAWSALEDVSATRLADALWCNTVLRSLDLSNNEITDAGATSLACALDGGLDGKVLEIEQTAADDFWESEIPLQANVGSLAGMTATHDLHKSLKKKPHLASGEPHSTKSLKILNSEGVLSNGLQVGNCTLQSINLGYNRLGEEGMKRVLEMFRKNEGITSISLAGAGKAPKGSDFGSVLQHNRLLRVLNLSGIGLTADAGLSLSNILSPAA